jgi:FkbM family methyltransferase
MIQALKNKFLLKEISKPNYIDKMFEQHKLLFEYSSLLMGVDIKSIQITPSGIVFTTKQDEIKFLCTKADKRTAPFEILNFDEYESDDANLLYQFINDGDVIFDIGANIGWYSMSFSKKFPNSTIHSFEPLPDTYNQLTQNIAINNLTNIQANNFGFSNETKTLTFYTSKDTSVSNSANNIADDVHATETTCSVITIDDYIAEKILAIDIIKCDVEGAELFVYQGGVKAIEKYKPIVFTEMLRKWAAKFGYHPNDIIQLFSQLGYHCFCNNGNVTIQKIDTVTDETINTNFFFLHPQKHALIISKYECNN